MTNNFQKCRDEVMQILAQNDTYQMTQKDLDILNEKYGQSLIIAVLDYLQQHGTIFPKDYKKSALPYPQIIPKFISLTAKGIDEVNQDDFGKKFNVVNFKIHDDTLEKLKEIINASDLKEDEKKSALIKLGEMGTSELIRKLIESTLSKATFATIKSIFF